MIIFYLQPLCKNPVLHNLRQAGFYNITRVYVCALSAEFDAFNIINPADDDAAAPVNKLYCVVAYSRQQPGKTRACRENGHAAVDVADKLTCYGVGWAIRE